jgi:gamma-glutamylputrescine oxidase
MYLWGMTLVSFWEEEAFWRADVGIVGGGLVGLSLAASLLERAPTTRVVLLERGLTPLGASTRNAGFLCLGSPSEICRNLQQIGESATVSLIAQRAAGIQRLRTRLGDSAIHYQPTGGYELIPSSYEWVLHKLDYLNTLLSEVLGGPYALLQDEKLPTFALEKRFGISSIYRTRGQRIRVFWCAVSGSM